MMKPKPVHWAWPLTLLFSSVAAGISAFALPGTLLCLVVTLWFLLVCPGMMLVRYLNLKEPQTEWTLAVALSLAIDALVASIALYAGVWFPPGILGILITLCIFGVIGQFVLTRRASFSQAGFSGRKSGNLTAFFLLLVLVALIAGLGVWSYNMRTRTATKASAAATHTPKLVSPTAQSPGVSVIATIIVMDNVDLITQYDPKGDRLKAAQLFASMLPLGSEAGIVRITSTLDPVQQFFAAHRGITVPVTDGPNLAAQLTMTYRTMLSGIDHTVSG